MESPDWNLYLVNNVKYIVSFPGLQVIHLDNSHPRNVQVPFVEKPQSKITRFQNYKNLYQILKIVKIDIWFIHVDQRIF